jgi:aldose 1-epimerase
LRSRKNWALASEELVSFPNPVYEITPKRKLIMSDASPHYLTAGGLQATFWPHAGMVCVSLRHHGIELLRRVEDLEAARIKGSTVGIPILYPWANRLSSLQYNAAGRAVSLDPASSLLHFDDHKLPMHGATWSQLHWEVISETSDTLVARLPWLSRALLDIFPFPHDVEMHVHLRPDALDIKTTVKAGSGSPVPLSFGFHPYFGLPGIPRSQWRLRAPAMRELALDARGIPGDTEIPRPALDGLLGNIGYDNCFALSQQQASFSISGAGYTITIEFQSGFRYAQIFAPKDKEFIAIEPMTAATNALVSGQGLQIVQAGEQFAASFRIAVNTSL